MSMRYSADDYKRTLFYRNDGQVRARPDLARQAMDGPGEATHDQ